jgi:ATP-dependent metalloprotease FtsH
MAEDQFNQQNNNDNSPVKGKGPRARFSFYWVYAILLVVFFLTYFINWEGPVKKASWGEIKDMLASGDISRIVLVNKETAEIYLKEGKIDDPKYKEIKEKESVKGPHFSYVIGDQGEFERDVKEAQANIPDQDKVYIENEVRRNWTNEILGWLLPIAVLVIVWLVIMRMMSRNAGGAGGQIFNIGKSKAQLFDKTTSVTINFNDVAGLEEAKLEVKEVVDFLKNPSKYTGLGGKIPKGVLLVGPPGTGKTLLAKAVAGEAQVPFFSLSGSDFVEMFVGVGASRVRDLFKQAKEKAPCIVFIDEIDAIGRARGKNMITGANDERESTLNQLLTEMDGFSTNSGVIIMAATNRADILDRALLRAGRFDRQINVELPDLDERKAIFKVHTINLKFDKVNVDLEWLAKQTPGFSGADIANVANEAALIAARKDKKIIERQDFVDAIDRIIGGLERRSKIISQDEKKVIAFHESGHATVSWLLPHAHPLVKVTIVPRGKALGAAWYLPEERQITTHEQMFDEMTATLGGRAAEKVIFGSVSTGALNDLERVTKQAYNMVVYFGLNDKLGNISYYDSTGQQEYSFQKPYSEKTAELIDQEIKKLVDMAYARALDILESNKDKLEELAGILLEKEVIFGEDLERIFGKKIQHKNHEIVVKDMSNNTNGSPMETDEPVSGKKKRSKPSKDPAGEAESTDKA